MDYSKIGLDKRLRRGHASTTAEYLTEYEQKYQFEEGPYSPPVLVNKGTISAEGAFEGTITDAILSAPSVTGGTINAAVFENTLDFSAGTVSDGEFQNITINSGTLNDSLDSSAGTLSGGEFKDVTVNAGTISNAIDSSAGTFSSGEFNNPGITGTPSVDFNTGTEVLSSSGNFSFQIDGGSVRLVYNAGGTTYYFTPDGEV